ncbi:Uncharacterised protein [uncultured archaeon]|nr:Uncharacterised protein [uncultured archaeon]
MEIKIENIDLLLPKKVPKHGKISGIKSEREAIRVIIPTDNTKLSLTVSEPSEVLVRNVTPDGKILGLTNFVGKTVFIIDQKEENFLDETKFEKLELSEKTAKKLYEMCKYHNLDPEDLFRQMKEASESKQTAKEGEENE